MGNDLKDLHVPDLSVCDSLISKGFLSDDDCQVINKTKRNKSKVKRLISILSKSEDPRAAFYALSKCIERTHEHLVDCVRAAADRFPGIDINSNYHTSGVEHDEYSSLVAANASVNYLQGYLREPIQHDEREDDNIFVGTKEFNNVTHSVCPKSDIEEIYSDKTYSKSLLHLNVNQNNESIQVKNYKLQSAGCVENTTDLSNNNGVCVNPETLLPFQNVGVTSTSKNVFDGSEASSQTNSHANPFFVGKHLPSFYKKLGIPCSDQETSIAKDTKYLRMPNTCRVTDEFLLGNKVQDTDYNKDLPKYSVQDGDDLDGDCSNNDRVNVTGGCLDYVDGLCSYDNNTLIATGSDIDYEESCGTGVVTCNSEVVRNRTSTDLKTNNSRIKPTRCLYKDGQFDRNPNEPQSDIILQDTVNIKSFSHLLNRTSQIRTACEASDDDGLVIGCDDVEFSSAGSCPETLQTGRKLKGKGLYERENTERSEDVGAGHLVNPFSSQNSVSTCQSDTGVVSDGVAGIKGLTPVFNNIITDRNKTEQISIKISQHNPHQSLSHLTSNFESHDIMPPRSNPSTDRSKLVSATCILRDTNIQKVKGNATHSNMVLNTMLDRQRAMSQIDYCPDAVIDNTVSRVHSWTGTRTRWLYDYLSSSSEDYTTTDVNLSDLNDVERELCDKLEQSGSITDIVDRLIQDEYFSNDDCTAVRELQVRRHQAIYVAKRISNISGGNRCETFSQLLENQPKLLDWLSAKFPNTFDDNSIPKTSSKQNSNEQTENKLDVTDDNQIHTEPKFRADNCSESCMACSANQTGACSDVALIRRESKPKVIYSKSDILCPAEIVVDRTFQKVFDALNSEFNKGTLPVTTLPKDPNTKCIVLYLKACDALYKAEYEDAERFIKLADAAVNDTVCPLFMRSEIFTQKTWLCLRTNRLGLMEKLLEENEQFLVANPNLWSNKAVGWFYFDYGRFNVTMMKITKPNRRQRRMNIKSNSMTAFEIYQDKAKKCLRKSIDYFLHSDSTDGPIGMGFSISLLASVELQCVSGDVIHSNVEEHVITDTEKLLREVANLFEEIPGVLKANFLLAKSDLCFRQKQIPEAKASIEESLTLSKELDLKEDLSEGLKRQKILNQLS